MAAGTRLVDNVHPVLALPSAVPSSAAARRVSLKTAHRLTILLFIKNATTVTGSAITLLQSQDVAGTGEKAFSFDRVWRNLDADAGDALAEATVAGDTFTTDATNSKNLVYAIDVDPAKLDVNAGFDCIKVGIGNATAATVTAVYLFSGLRYGGPLHTSKIAD